VSAGAEIRKGDRVRERAWRVPAGCRPFQTRVEEVAPDGWVTVRLGPRWFSFAPHEVEKIEKEATAAR
jgi:hypothetical protein